MNASEKSDMLRYEELVESLQEFVRDVIPPPQVAARLIPLLDEAIRMRDYYRRMPSGVIQ